MPDGTPPIARQLQRGRFNRFLAILPPHDFSRLAEHLRTVALERGTGHSTSFFGRDGAFQGTLTRTGDTTNFYDRAGRYQGSVTTMPPPSTPRTFNFKRRW
jgi:hypothetical protein